MTSFSVGRSIVSRLPQNGCRRGYPEAANRSCSCFTKRARRAESTDVQFEAASSRSEGTSTPWSAAAAASCLPNAERGVSPVFAIGSFTALQYSLSLFRESANKASSDSRFGAATFC